MTADQVRSILRKACDEAGSIRQWAQDHNVSKSLISCILTGKRVPSYYVLRSLGLRKVVTYEAVE